MVEGVVQAGHRFGPTDPADPDDFSWGTDLAHPIKLDVTNEQLHQGTGVAEQDHQLNPAPIAMLRKRFLEEGLDKEGLTPTVAYKLEAD